MRQEVPAALAGERVDRVVAMMTGLPRAEVAGLVAAGAVRVSGRLVTVRSRKLAEGDVVEVEVPEPGDARPGPDPTVPLVVIHEDESVIVLDKQPGLVVHPGAGNESGTLVNGVLARWPEVAEVGDVERPGIVHRLDKGTSGLLVVARTQDAYESLVTQLHDRTVERRYLGVAAGVFENDEGLIDAPLGRSTTDPIRMAVTSAPRGREARTRYQVRERFTDPLECALVECRLETGRTHQIRVHLAAIGHPVLGDARYGGVRAALASPRPFLHAFALGFTHPASGELVQFSSPLPSDLEEVRARLS